MRSIFGSKHINYNSPCMCADRIVRLFLGRSTKLDLHGHKRQLTIRLNLYQVGNQASKQTNNYDTQEFPVTDGFFYHEASNKSDGIAQEEAQDRVELNLISVCIHRIPYFLQPSHTSA